MRKLVCLGVLLAVGACGQNINVDAQKEEGAAIEQNALQTNLPSPSVESASLMFDTENKVAYYSIFFTDKSDNETMFVGDVTRKVGSSTTVFETVKYDSANTNSAYVGPYQVDIISGKAYANLLSLASSAGFQLKLKLKAERYGLFSAPSNEIILEVVTF